MENLQQVNTSQVQLSGTLPVSNMIGCPAPAKPEMKEDGGKKLLGALAGLAAVGGAIALGVGVAKGKINLKKIGQNISEAATNNKVTKEAAQQAAIEKSLQNVPNVNQDAQKIVTNAKKGISEAVANNNAQSKLQKQAADFQSQIDKFQKALNEQTTGDLITIDGVQIKRSMVQGQLGNLKGELKATEKALKNTQTVDVEALGKNLSKKARQSREVNAVVEMQRQTRKHPNISAQAQEQIYNNALNSTPSKKAADLHAQYLKYMEHATDKQRSRISEEIYMRNHRF